MIYDNEKSLTFKLDFFIGILNYPVLRGSL